VVSRAAYDLMEELYFVIAFNELQISTGIDAKVLVKILEELLKASWVDQLKFDGNEYQKLEKPNFTNITQDAFLASKNGLLVHNGFGK